MARESIFSIKDIYRDRRKLKVFLICVAVSVFMWTLISLGKDYNSTIAIPVKYINFPENKTLLNSVPDRLSVSVSGSGYDLLQYDDRLEEDTLVINLDNLKIVTLGDYQRGYLEPSILAQELQNRLNGMLAINRVLSDSIEFMFDLKVSRTVRVMPRVEYELEGGYVLLDSVHTLPAEVEIYGALSILDTLQHVKTNAIQQGLVNRSQRMMTGLDISRLGNDARVSPDSVSIQLNVDKLTEKRFLITPEMLNVPDSLTMLVFPNAVELTIQVPLTRFDEVQVNDFQVEVDYNDLEEGYQVLPVHLESWPVVAERVSMKPEQVEIVLSRND